MAEQVRQCVVALYEARGVKMTRLATTYERNHRTAPASRFSGGRTERHGRIESLKLPRRSFFAWLFRSRGRAR